MPAALVTWCGLVALLMGMTACGAGRSEQAAAVAWAAQHAVPLGARVDQSSESDLRAISRVVGSVRVVGFGEAAHGAHEFLVLRNYLFRTLVEEMGFTAIVAETHPVHAELADRYVQGRAQLDDEVVESVFAANRTFSWRQRPLQENYELLKWMREYNTRLTTRRAIHFYGMDTRHPFSAEAGAREPDDDRVGTGATMARHVLRVLEHEGQQGRILVFAHNAHLELGDMPSIASEATLGQLLQRALGDGLRVIGTSYDRGQLQDGGNRTSVLPLSEPGSVSDLLAQVGKACFLIELRQPPPYPTGAAWFEKEQRMRGSFWQGKADYYFVRPSAAFDALLFVRSVTPVRAVLF